MNEKSIIRELEKDGNKMLTLYRKIKVGISKDTINCICNYLLEKHDLLETIKPVIRTHKVNNCYVRADYREMDSARNGKPQEDTPDEKFKSTGKHTREEEHKAMELFKQGCPKYGQGIDNLGFILDYQTPIGGNLDHLTMDGKSIDNPDEKGKKYKPGKVDILSYEPQNNVIYILELKIKGNKESILKAILEAYTYKMLLNRENLVKNMQDIYPSIDIKDDAQLIAAPLIELGSKQYEEYKTCKKDSPLYKLIKEMREKVFLWNPDNDEFCDITDLPQ